MKASNAFVLIAALGCSGAALADDTVKSGGNLDKPGRAIDEDTVRSGGRLDKPGREVDGDTVKSGGRSDKPGRALDGNVANSGTDKPDNQVETANRPASPTNTR
jgi:hypothetical protein